MECARSWSSGIFRRWIQRWAMGSLSVWGDVRSFAVTEYDRICDSGIFRSWWPKVMSPHNFKLQLKDCGITDPELAPGWAYFVEEEKYQAFLKDYVDQPEVLYY